MPDTEGRRLADEELRRAQAAIPTLVFDPNYTLIPGFVNKSGVANMAVRSDDVFICSYPKSGTNWVKQIVHQLRLVADQALQEECRVSELDLSHFIPYVEAQISTIDWVSLEKILPRAFHTHLAWQDVPKGARYIYVHRDPVDVTVSLYNYLKGFEGHLVDHLVDDMAQLMMEGLVPYGSWRSHLRSFWSERTHPDLLFVSYADLKEDLSAEISRIAKFLQLKVTAAGISKVVNVSTLEFMRSQNAKIMGAKWLKEATGLEAKDNYQLVNGGRNKHAELVPKVLEALQAHFAEEAGHVLGRPASYADVRAAFRHGDPVLAH